MSDDSGEFRLPSQGDFARLEAEVQRLWEAIEAQTALLLKVADMLEREQDPDPGADDVRDLDGQPAGGERDQTQSLDAPPPAPARKSFAPYGNCPHCLGDGCAYCAGTGLFTR